MNGADHRPGRGLLGLNFASIDQLVARPAVLDRYLEVLHEAGLGTIRVPVYWNRLQRREGDRFVTDGAMLERYHAFLGRLPPGIRVLGLLLHTPPQVAVDYFHDPSSMPGMVGPWAGFVAGEFPEIDDWEVWNEPNASDFYLSVADGGGHRPWTGAEFVDHVVRPVVSAVRSRRPGARISFPAFAENGIVGHRDRPPALSNRLPDDGRFGELRDASGHGRFFFVPDFAPDALSAVSDGLVDAFSFHPYPYFGIGEQPYWQHSVELADAFFALVERSGFGDAEVWVTEVGCRSFDPRKRNRRDETQQSAFVRRFPADAGFGTRISRLYWYKFNDLAWDLRQEKSFGIFDHHLLPKRSYFHFRSLLHREGIGATARTVVSDRFEYGVRFDTGCFDPQYWDETTNNRFAFGTTSLAPGGEPEVLLFPGRSEGDHLGIESRQALEAADGGRLMATVGVGVPDPSPMRLHLALFDDDGERLGLDVSFSAERLVPTVSVGEREFELPPLSIDLDGLSRVSLVVDDGDLAMLVHVDGAVGHIRHPIDGPIAWGGSRVRLAVTRGETGRGYLSLSHVAVTATDLDLAVFAPLRSDPESGDDWTWDEGAG